MKEEIKKWDIDEIKKAVGSSLQLHFYDFIEARDEDGRATSMSIKTFFENLERELNRKYETEELIKIYNRKYQEDIETFGEDNMLGYVVSSVALITLILCLIITLIVCIL